MNTTPELYCGTYHKYACGSLSGRWVDLTRLHDAGDFPGYCKRLHDDGQSPGLMFQDYIGFPESLYPENMGTDDIQRIYDYIGLCGMNDRDATGAFLTCFSKDDYDELADYSDYGRYGNNPLLQDYLGRDGYYFARR